MRSGAGGGRLEIAGLGYLSAQHYPLPAAGVIDGAMPSCGALPMHVVDTHRILVPMFDSDAAWFGLTAIGDAGLSVRGILETAERRYLDIASGLPWHPRDWGAMTMLALTPLYGIPRDGGGTWPYALHPAHPCAPACRRLHLHLTRLDSPGVKAETHVSLSFVRPAAYRRLTRMDPGQPADPAHRFGKFLLA